MNKDSQNKEAIENSWKRFQTTAEPSEFTMQLDNRLYDFWSQGIDHNQTRSLGLSSELMTETSLVDTASEPSLFI